MHYSGLTRADRLISVSSGIFSRGCLVHPNDCFECPQLIEPNGCGRKDEEDEADEADEEDEAVDDEEEEADDEDDEDEAGEEDEYGEADEEDEEDEAAEVIN